MPKVSMKFFFCILLVIVILPSCLGTDAIVFTSDFNRMVAIKIPANAIPGLRQKGINISDIEQMPKAIQWHIGNYPKGCRFYKQKNRWGISTPETLSIYSNLCRSCVRNYRLILDVEMPKDAETESSTVSIGIVRHGLINGGKTVCGNFKIARGANVSCETKLRLDHGVPQFQVMLTISGNVILKKFTLEECPDDLASDDITVLEGIVADRSPLPDPKKSDYPDCRFTALFDGNNIISGACCPRKIQLVIDGFIDRKPIRASTIKPGDKVRCTIIPFEKLPDRKKAIQQSDTLDLFELTSYYVLEIERIKIFSKNSTIPFVEKQQKYVSVFKISINPPLSEELKNAQRQDIKDALAQINRMLAPYANEAELVKLEDRFSKAWDTEKAKDAHGVNRCGNNLVWRNINNSFWALPIKYCLIPKRQVLEKSNLDALVALQEFLNVHGCQLIIGLIPDCHAISARVITREFRDVPDFKSAWLIQQMLSNNLEAVYISDRLLKDFNRHPFAFFYPSDGHPSDTTQDILTDVLAERLSRYNFTETLDKNLFSTDLFPHIYGTQKMYLFPKNCDIGKNTAGTPYLCRRVLYDGKEVLPDSQSPILVLGNSFIQTPMKYPDSLPSLLASKIHMGIAVNRIGAMGPVTIGINQFLADPKKHLAGKKVVILIMSVGHFLDGNINNIKTMDEQMLQLSGKTPTGMIAISGNEKNTPGRYRQLNNARCFSIPPSGKCLVVDRSLPHVNKKIILAIPVCAHSPCPAKLKVNGMPLAIPATWGTYRWDKIVVPVPQETTHLTIELEGRPGTAVALGDIQIFQ